MTRRTTTNASQLDRLLRVAEEEGAIIDIDMGHVDVNGKTYRRAHIRVRDNKHAVSLLNAFARSDAAEDPEIRDLGIMFAQGAAQRAESDEQLARRLLAFVQENVVFTPEEGEKFRLSSLTLKIGAGDCDDSARLLAALSIASGIPARVVLVKNSQGEESHVAAQVYVNGGWSWAETTFPALFGEHPRAAAERLGLLRGDVS